MNRPDRGRPVGVRPWRREGAVGAPVRAQRTDGRPAGFARRHLVGVVVLVAFILVSRAALVGRGFRFDLEWIGLSVQDIDQRLLHHRLLQSLWYLHGQPPLWNALLGLSMTMGASVWTAAWHLAFIALALVEAVALYALLLEVRVPSRPAVAITAVFMVAPEVLVYENGLTYDYPTMALVTLAALAVARYVDRPTLTRSLLVFAPVTALVLVRTIFQWPWLLLVAALLLVVRRAEARALLFGASIAVVLVGAVIAKNWVMYGVPSTTSWSGMMLARSAVLSLPLSERRRLVVEGKLHPVSLVEPLSSLSAYEAVGIRPDRPTGVPLLDERGDAIYPRNLENRTFIRISRLYWQDDLWILEHRQHAYLRWVGHGLTDFFAPATLASQGSGNAGKIGSYERWYDRIIYGRFGPGRDGIFLILFFTFALAAGIWITARQFRRSANAETAVIAFSTLTVLYVTVVGSLAEVGENYRFRLVLQPLVLVLAAAGVSRLASRTRRVSTPTV